MHWKSWLAAVAAFLVIEGSSRALPPPGQVFPPQAPGCPETRVKSGEELRVEQIIEDAYRRCFKTYVISGVPITLRIPFGQNEEREGSPGFSQRIFLGGKGSPEEIWTEIDALLESADFYDYLFQLEQPGDKVIKFDLEARSYAVYLDPVLVGIMKKGPYPGSRTRVFVLKSDAVLSAVDIYNYLYGVGSVGMDCSGFIYYIQKSIAAAYGYDLDRALAKPLRTSAARVPQIVGLWLFDPTASFAERVQDSPQNLRPGDIFLFRGRELLFRHSAVIQSIDFAQGLIRYVQCTDWAPQEERGVHDSLIRFNSARSNVSLKDDSVEWTQEIFPTFPGEPSLRYWRNDGDRYRSYMQAGGSVIVRLKLIKALLEQADPQFYQLTAE